MSIANQSRVVVFDAVCVLCCAGVHWIIRHDPGDRWRFVSMQSPQGQACLREAGLSTAAPASFIVIRDQQWFTESEACLIIADEAGLLWRTLAKLGRVFPRGLRDALYRLIARNRYRWFGRNEQCFVPQAQQRHKFLSD